MSMSTMPNVCSTGRLHQIKHKSCISHNDGNSSDPVFIVNLLY